MPSCKGVESSAHDATASEYFQGDMCSMPAMVIAVVRLAGMKRVTTMIHALTTQAVDIVLAGLLLIGSVSGAQIGTRIALSAKPEYLRLTLAAVVLLVAIRMLIGLGFVPDEVFTVTPL